MIDLSELERQSQALMKFASSAGRPLREFAWPYCATMPEPLEHRLWRLYAASVHRFSMFYEAALVAPDEQAFYDRLFMEIAECERAARAAWQQHKEKLEMDFLCGRRKTLPWKC